MASGHRWEWGGDICAICFCTRNEYLDAIRPYCHPTGNALAIVARKLKLRWNRFVHALATLIFRGLTI